jgi:hypothetical protein
MFVRGRASASQPSPSPAVPVGPVSSTLAWVIAVLPLVAIPLSLGLGGGAVTVVAVATLALAFVDARQLPEGRRNDWLWALLTGGPYLLARQRALRSTPAIPGVWLLSVIVAVGVLAVVAVSS